jgi:transcriptional regulator with XRE-family HTH domain
MARNTAYLGRRSSRDAGNRSDLVQLGRGIREMRSRRSLPRKLLASRLGVSCKVLGYWERGQTRPPFEKLISLWRELEVTPDELLAAGEKESTRRRAREARRQLERRRTMSDETSVVVEPGPVDPLVGTEDPDLKSERVQDE